MRCAHHYHNFPRIIAIIAIFQRHDPNHVRLHRCGCRLGGLRRR
jgi:hypothetical protein